MINKLRLYLSALLTLITFNCYSIIANPEPYIATQADGNTLEVILHGDEYFNFYSTSDNIPVVLNGNNEWVYASLNAAGKFIPSAMTAKSPQSRTSEEVVIAESYRVDKDILHRYYNTFRALRSEEYKSDVASTLFRKSRIRKSNSSKEPEYRGLVVLVEYNDKKFSRPDIADIFNEMINREGYKGFTDSNGKQVSYTGSVRDYFIDNSDGKFSPVFDVVGPVSVPYSCKDPQQSSKVRPILAAALDAIDKDVDFKNYDMNGDGVVDMIYFIFSGAGSNVSGNSAYYLWPHASILTELEYDGVKAGRYACSTELYGLESRGIIDGIGVICHEFSHVLGLQDLYDVDYATGGQSIHPGVWSVMAGGAYLNSCRTPSSYCAYERYASGFITPHAVTEGGQHSLAPVQDGGKVLKIPSSVPDEFFLLECRRKKRWDEHLPGEGLIVWRVDSTDASAWVTNHVNAIPEHNYLELIRANSQCTGTTTKDTEHDPFPGASSVTSLTNTTNPSMRSWTGIESPYVLSSISYTDGLAEVTVTSENLQGLLEDFESMNVSESDNSKNISGKFGKWELISAKVSSPENKTYIAGEKALEFVKGSEAIISEIGSATRALSFSLGNSSISTTIVRCHYGVGEGDWEILRTNDGSENISVGPKSSRTVTFPCEIPENASIKISMTTGNSSTPTYIDNVRLVVNKKTSSSVGEISKYSDLKVRKISDLTVEVLSEECEEVVIYDSLGNKIAMMNLGEYNSITLPRAGIYILRQGTKSIKFII